MWRRFSGIPRARLIGAVLVLLLVAGLWLLRGHRSAPNAVPPYEEAEGNGFTTLVRDVELAIYDSLRQVGVEASQVHFRKVVHHGQGNRQWDYAELEVSLPRGGNLHSAKEVLSRNLGAVHRAVTWEVYTNTGPDLEVRITVGEVLTHRLALNAWHRGTPRAHRAAPAARLAIVIDDLGYDSRLARRFLELDAPLSFSVLPHGTFSKSIARSIHLAGRELLLHLPMEPKGYPDINPGIGALLTNMTDAALVQKLRENLDAVPYIVGVNNHMGSKFCEYEEKMILVMEEIRQRGLFFLDSRTSKRTRGYSVATHLGVPSVERDVFLDNVQNPNDIRIQMNRLIQLARFKGKAIGIGHPHECTLGVLEEVIPRLAEQGVELVPVSQLVHQ
jgi:hypothetical protein